MKMMKSFINGTLNFSCDFALVHYCVYKPPLSKRITHSSERGLSKVPNHAFAVFEYYDRDELFRVMILDFRPDKGSRIKQRDPKKGWIRQGELVDLLNFGDKSRETIRNHVLDNLKFGLRGKAFLKLNPVIDTHRVPLKKCYELVDYVSSLKKDRQEPIYRGVGGKFSLEEESHNCASWLIALLADKLDIRVETNSLRSATDKYTYVDPDRSCVIL